MCPSCEPEQNGNGHTNGNGVDRSKFVSAPAPKKVNNNPYAPVGDFLSNVGRFQIIESTLRYAIASHSCDV